MSNAQITKIEGDEIHALVVTRNDGSHVVQVWATEANERIDNYSSRIFRADAFDAAVSFAKSLIGA